MKFFNAIYDAAKHFNSHELEELIKLGGSIDENYKFNTPASKLITDGYLEAGEFLILFGANVQYIAFSAAKSGNLIFCDQLIKNFKNVESKVAEGAVAGGYIDYAEKLFQIKNINIQSLYSGAAMAENKSYIAYLNKIDHKKFYCDKNQYFLLLIIGATLGKKYEFRKLLIAELKKYALTQTEQDKIIMYNALMRPEIYKQNFKSFAMHKKKLIAIGAVIGGYFDFADMLLKEHFLEKNRFIQNIAETAVEYGHLQYAKQFNKVNNEAVIERAIYGGSLSIFDRVGDQVKEISKNKIYMFKQRFPDNRPLVYSLYSINNKLIRESLANQINENKIYKDNLVLDDKLMVLQRRYALNCSQIKLLKNDLLIYLIFNISNSNLDNLNTTIISHILTFVIDINFINANSLIINKVDKIKKEIYNHKTHRFDLDFNIKKLADKLTLFSRDSKLNAKTDLVNNSIIPTFSFD